jgi:hypothetical protein
VQCRVVARTPVLQQLADDFGRNLRQLVPLEPLVEFLGSNLASRMTDVKPLEGRCFNE